MATFWGPILGRAIAALLGFGAALLVDFLRHRKQKDAIIKALQREIEYNNSIIQKMVNERWVSGHGYGSPLDGLQVASYLKALGAGVMAEFPASQYEEILTVYQVILEIRRLIDSGIRIAGRVNPRDKDNKVFWVEGIDSRGSAHYIIGIEQLPQRLSKLASTSIRGV
jgi:hypothetical protein